MPKHYDSLETSLLIIELLRRIPARRKISAQQLQEQLQEAGYPRDIRSIQRLLRKVSEHFDVERDDKNKPHGYRWNKDSKGFSVPRLGEHESLLLTLAEQHLSDLLPPSLMQSMRAFFDQARTNLDQSQATKAREWLAKVRVVSQNQPLLPPKIDKRIFQEVSKALYDNRWLQLKYKNAEGNITEADIMPLGLAQQGARLYLICRFEGFDNERSLALHRMQRARATDFTFTRPKNFDLQQYDESGRFGFSKGEAICLSFEIKKEAGLHLLESPLSNDQKVKETKTHYQIKATVMDTWQLTWWLHGFSSDVRNIKKTSF
jgi:predicted DNA-binding transcriptional regulator YafY